MSQRLVQKLKTNHPGLRLHFRLWEGFSWVGGMAAPPLAKHNPGSLCSLCKRPCPEGTQEACSFWLSLQS